MSDELLVTTRLDARSSGVDGVPKRDGRRQILKGASFSSFSPSDRNLFTLDEVCDPRLVRIPGAEAFLPSAAECAKPTLYRQRIELTLKCCGVQLDAWGKDDAKSFTKFLSELASGEIQMQIQGNEIFLHSRVILFRVIAKDINHQAWKIVETQQVFFEDGRTRVRYSMGGLPGEKMKPGEIQGQAARRGLSEELGVEKIVEMQTTSHKPNIVSVSKNFPGMIENQEFFFVNVNLPFSEVNRLRHGYVEVTKAMETHFAWMPNEISKTRFTAEDLRSLPEFCPLGDSRSKRSIRNSARLAP